MGMLDALRSALGTDSLPRMEILMATAAAQIAELNTKFNDLASDVSAGTAAATAAYAILETKVGQLDAEGQAALDALSASIATLDSAVGDADGSDTPVVPVDPPVEPSGF